MYAEYVLSYMLRKSVEAAKRCSKKQKQLGWEIRKFANTNRVVNRDGLFGSDSGQKLT